MALFTTCEAWPYQNGAALHNWFAIEELEGIWMNVDCPLERYVVEGLQVTRTDIRGTTYFTLRWSDQQERWEWGTYGKLFLEWRTKDSVAWVSDSQHKRSWRWKRCLPSRQAATVPIPPNGLCPQTSWRSHHAEVHGSHSAGRRWSRQHWSRRPHGERVVRERSRSPRRIHHNYHGFAAGSVRLPCGLTQSEAVDLLTRDITPEDYDLLLELDHGNRKPTATVESVEGLPEASPEDVTGGECTVCLSNFVSGDAVVALPCRHCFHRSCITTWLSECRRTCPLCSTNAVAV